MAMVALTLGSFLVIQWPYIFAHVAFETDLSKLVFATYSEYVRKGFLEFITVALFVYSLIWIGLLALRGKTSKYLSTIQLIVLAEFGIFLLSLFRRIALYQTFHGWSLIRIYGGLFLVFILGLTITLALRHIIKKNWILVEACWAAALFIFIMVFNAESYIVTSHPPTVNKRVDYIYMSRMSTDGLIGWQKAQEHTETTIHSILDLDTLITKDQRREVAYSAIVIQNLMQNYQDLIVKYGTEKEVREYYKAITLLYKNKLIEWNSDPLKQPFDVQNITDEINKTAKLYEQLSNEKIALKDIKIKVQIYTMINPSSSGNTFDPQALKRTPLTFYTISFYDDSYPYSGLVRQVERANENRMFIWNKSEYDAYIQLKNTQSFTYLNHLADHYLELYKRISNQSPKERDYEQDISFNSPLL
jgi:hypothetical protein